jgi:hypothetical protein
VVGTLIVPHFGGTGPSAVEQTSLRRFGARPFLHTPGRHLASRGVRRAAEPGRRERHVSHLVTGYDLDFSFLDIPVLDEWIYPRHSPGIPEVAGLYAVELPWLTSHASATLALVGEDAQYVAEHIAGRNPRG